MLALMLIFMSRQVGGAIWFIEIRLFLTPSCGAIAHFACGVSKVIGGDVIMVVALSSPAFTSE